MYGSVSDVRGNAGAPSSVSCSGRSGSDATRCHGVQVQIGAIWVPSLCHHCLDLFGSLPLVIEFVYIVSELFILHLIVCRSKVCPMIPVCSSKPSHVRNRLRKRKGCSISIGFNAQGHNLQDNNIQWRGIFFWQCFFFWAIFVSFGFWLLAFGFWLLWFLASGLYLLHFGAKISDLRAICCSLEPICMPIWLLAFGFGFT